MIPSGIATVSPFARSEVLDRDYRSTPEDPDLARVYLARKGATDCREVLGL